MPSPPSGADGATVDELTAALRSPFFQTMLSSRIIRATSAHAFYAQEFLGRDDREPGPHALLLLSAVPRQDSTANVVAAARLFHLGEADDLPSMVDGMAQLVRDHVASARRDRRLLAYLSMEERIRVARQALSSASTWEPSHGTFPYLAALQKSLLWDPRMPELGITGTADQELGEDAIYCGVAVTTLDTEAASWVSIKHRYAGAKDPVNRMPLTPASVAAHAWALLEGETALHVHRMPTVSLDDTAHEVVANHRLEPSPSSRGRTRFDPDLLRKPTALYGDVNLWERLYGLHTAIRYAFGYRRQP